MKGPCSLLVIEHILYQYSSVSLFPVILYVNLASRLYLDVTQHVLHPAVLRFESCTVIIPFREMIDISR